MLLRAGTAGHDLPSRGGRGVQLSGTSRRALQGKRGRMGGQLFDDLSTMKLSNFLRRRSGDLKRRVRERCVCLSFIHSL